jgi:hypothetical protein
MLPVASLQMVLLAALVLLVLAYSGCWGTQPLLAMVCKSV